MSCVHGRAALGGALLGAALVAGSMAAPALGPEKPMRMDPDPAFLAPGETRSFQISYTGRVKDIPEGTKTLRVWMPVPQDTPLQTIKGLEFFGEPRPRMTTEKVHGNLLAYYEVANPGREAEFSYSFTCSRKELITDFAKIGEEAEEKDPAAAFFLKDNQLTIVDDRIRKMAAEVVAGKRTTVEKARAIYEHVFEKMAYDKSGTGWGRGDTNFACDVGKGNCTDFHALFTSLCRAEGIASGFEIGLYPPYKRNSEEKLGGYHCWAWFRVPGRTWVPVDISEADRFPERKEYFFGSHTSNRVTLSVGRDLVLEPAQAGEPLNYLLNPHAEADGRKVATDKSWTLKDLD
ncbi:MAG: transglutaminase domain-containing protein [Planctomycetaceae bacterium]|nr:transglutaminase-like domain-containing protein [Planctomycetota bacterium]NUN53774.1 transglutaminase domain-containing protein [Planctomycetaceae bacterium]